MQLKALKDLNVENKRVLVRLDLNLPRKNGKVTDHTRIIRSLETIKYLVANKAKVIILSHLGRPKGQFNRNLSLAPIADELQKFLQQKIAFCVDIFSSNATTKIERLQPGQILLMENLRFWPGEEQNDPKFVSRLAEIGDLYVNDTFSCSHRAHASIEGIAKKLPSASGFLLQNELDNISTLLTNPLKPLGAIIGGSKVSSKLSLLKNLVTKTDYLIIGGAMANNFLKANKIDIGSSPVEDDLLPDTLEILQLADKHNCKIILPVDGLIGDELIEGSNCYLSHLNGNKLEGKIFDIGPRSLKLIEESLSHCRTIIWNGPIGAFETEPYDISSRQMARILADYTIFSEVKTIAGGGDTLAAIKTTGLTSSFTYISTGGGAFLEWLEGKPLPGIEVLKI